VGDYTDRLDPASYSEDPIVAVYPHDVAESLDVPERVFCRLVYVAKGYSLHLLRLLGDSDPIRLNRPMIQTFVDELRFVGERLNDPVTDLWVDRLLQIAQATLWRRGDVYLTVEAE
jgi:hypothetical protein